jgi:CHAT domain-containing protein/tetratricopeptide (TPR) repeat protein
MAQGIDIKPFLGIVLFANYKISSVRLFIRSSFLSIFLIVILTQKTVGQEISVKDSIDFYFENAKYQRAEALAWDWVEKVKKSKGEKSSEYGIAITSLGHILWRDCSSEEGEALVRKGLEIQQGFGEINIEVAKSLNILAEIESDFGWDSLAERHLLQSMEIQKKTSGETEILFGQSLFKLAKVYSNRDQNLAKETYLKSLRIFEQKSGPQSVNVAKVFINLGQLYDGRLGDFGLARKYVSDGLSIFEKLLEKSHPNLGTAYASMGSIESRLGNFQNSESCFKRALECYTTSMGPESIEVAWQYMHLANVYKQFNDLIKAESCFLKCLTIYNKVHDNEEYESYSICYLGMSSLYEELNDLKQSRFYSYKALRIRENMFGAIHPTTSMSYAIYGSTLRKMCKYDSAEYFLLKAKRIQDSVLPAKSPYHVFNLFNLGVLFKDKGEIEKSISYLSRCTELHEQSAGKHHPSLATYLTQLGELYFNFNTPEKAIALLSKGNENRLANIRKFFPAMSDGQKSKFYTTMDPDFELYTSVLMSLAQKNPQVIENLYDTKLATKALLLNTSARWKQRIKTSGDKKLFALYTRWEDLQSTISALYSTNSSSAFSGLDSLLSQSDEIEKELSLRSERFGQPEDNRANTWKEIRATLKPGDAAIEIIRFRKYGVANKVIDSSNREMRSYKIKGLTDSIMYGALIVRPLSKSPELVLLGNGNFMEDGALAYYKNCIHGQTMDEHSYNHFWRKIGIKLGTGVKRIYLSPDGVYHSINLNTLLNPTTRKFLIDETNIQLVTSTKDFLVTSKSESQNQLAFLIGSPNFNSRTTDRQKSISQVRTFPELSYTLNLSRGDSLIDLPGTKKEIENISSLLTERGWDVLTLTGVNAIEESLKESYKPRVLHIATHGYFHPDKGISFNSLTQSGLLLSGANRTLAGEKTEKSEDGILTAYEAMNLNLDNTDLVVLSACETGLGEIKNGEGVYGLQRAFKVAGAKSIIMSLWKVNDEATQNLMVSFYKHWLISGNKREAFIKAQKELKARLASPYYWGGFVMLGQ